MKKAQLLLGIIIVGIGVALTYHVFENIVHSGIDLIWYDWFNTDEHRLLVIPLAIVFSLAFFGIQHVLDKKSESHQEHGLGNMPDPTAWNYSKVLLIGFFSLIAGASLGPEAILVPASMILGALVGVKLSKDKLLAKILTAAAIVALFTAFFHSIIVGVLSVMLVTKQAKVKVNPKIILIALISSVTSYLTLLLVGGKSYFHFPPYSWAINIKTILACLLLVAAGFAVNYSLKYVFDIAKKIHTVAAGKSWLRTALLAAIVLSILYLLGGPLVEFTGNESIVPMLNQSASLGLSGLLVLVVTKVAAMAWSKGAGYRGGMIFPTIFLASVLIAIVQLYIKDFNFIYGLITVLFGAFVADRKTEVLV